MAAHNEILKAAIRIAGARSDWTFTADEMVRALPHVNPGTVRTHVTSRCCVNAPTNHPHKWDYFKRVDRGKYQVLPAHRPRRSGASVVRERATAYGGPSARLRHVIHAAVTHGDAWYTAECLEIAVVTQGRTLDETLANLREAIALHLEGEDRSALGLATPLQLQVTFEEQVA